MKSTILATLGVFVLTGSLLAQSRQPAGEAFSWNGELVAFDETARIITVKSPVVDEQAAAQFGRLKSGERVMLTWSGYERFADAIREVRSGSAGKPEERFTFPVEFVSFNAEQRYATFKVQIPGQHIANLKQLKPGEWITATSPHGASSRSTPILVVKPYVDRVNTTNSN
jgi:hypothetical protein